MTVDVLEKELKEGKLNSIYLFYGEETYLLQNCLKRIKKNFGDLILGINYIQIDESNVDSLIPELQTPAFGYEKKLIVVNANLFKKIKSKKQKNENDNENEDEDESIKENQNQIAISKYIEEHIEEIKDSVILVFVEESVNKTKLYKVIEENGIVCDFEKLKPNELGLRLKAICSAYKVQIDSNTMMYFIETCGTNMQSLINEIRKLIEYAGENGTITKEDIDSLSIKDLEARIFDLTDSLGKKDTKSSIELLNELLYNKEPIQKILITLYNHFKKLYTVKLCEKYKEDITNNLNLKPNQMFLVSKYKRQSSYFKEEELRKILSELIELDNKTKIGKIDINVGLESILCVYF